MNKDLADDVYFEHYCSGVDIVFGNNLDEVAFVKTANFMFHYVSQGYLDLLYPDKPDVTVADVVGKRSGRIKSDRRGEGFDKVFLEQDSLVRNSTKVHRFLYINTHNKIFIVTKRPIINPATGNFVGIFCCMRNFMHPHILNLIYKINDVDFGMANTEQIEPLKYKLTQRQHMVLFLYLQKYSYSEIASIMATLGHKISAGRVNDHLENLKYIFAVKNKEQLIEIALSYKYHLFIPRQFLKPGSYLLDDEVVISEE
jgi:DNA-binding CsgD family transcriptional regulator